MKVSMDIKNSFGSASTLRVRDREYQIFRLEALEKQGHEVERANIRMPQGPLKQVGEFPIEIALHTDVAVTIKVAVLGEQ